MGRGYAGANVIADLDIHYDYQGHEYDEFGDFTNLLQMSLSFAQNTDNYATNIAHIMEQAEEYARTFLEENGNFRTGNLYGSIRARRVNESQWTLEAPARDDRNDGTGHLYAGHIEYGFTDKLGQSHGPWPFLRPAVKLAAMDSRGELANAMANNLLFGTNLNGGYPEGKVAFGRSNESFSYMKGSRAFYNMKGAYQRFDTTKGKTVDWGRAKNGFNDYGKRYPTGTSSNRWTTGTDRHWDSGEL